MLRIALTLALCAPAAVPALASAASARDTLIRYRISFTAEDTFKDGFTTGLSTNFAVPATWTALKQTKKTHRSFHAGSANCRYSVTFTTRLVKDDGKTATEHVTHALPVPASAYLLDYGTRGASAAWRVTRLKTTDQTVKLQAMRVDRRTLAGNQRAWRETVVSATSRKRDECHSGSYRASLGPQVGNALATATGSAYVIETSKLS